MANLKLVNGNTVKGTPNCPTIVTGLCPRSWGNTDVSPLSRVQINGILDNCEKCQRYSQCNKVAELNDRLVELDNESEEN